MGISKERKNQNGKQVRKRICFFMHVCTQRKMALSYLIVKTHAEIALFDHGQG